MNYKLSLNDIAYCGLNCRTCHLTTILPQSATHLRDIMAADGWEHFGDQVHPEFKDFWKVLNALAESAETCPMCKGGCGNPECGFRKCARERGLELCAQCADYPCEPIQEFFAGAYRPLEKNNQTIRVKGVDAFLEEQQALVDAGATFSSLTQE
jgi:hypothetical protein